MKAAGTRVCASDHVLLSFHQNIHTPGGKEARDSAIVKEEEKKQTYEARNNPVKGRALIPSWTHPVA